MSASLEGLLEVANKRIYRGTAEDGSNIYYIRVDSEHMAESFERTLAAMGIEAKYGEYEKRAAVVITKGLDIIDRLENVRVHDTFASKVRASTGNDKDKPPLCKGMGWY